MLGGGDALTDAIKTPLEKAPKEKKRTHELEKRHFAVWSDFGRFSCTFPGGPGRRRRLEHSNALQPRPAPQTTGTPGSPTATTTISGEQLPPPPQKFGGIIESQRRAVEAVLAGARRPAEGRAERPLDHDRRYRLRRLEHLRRRDPDAEPRPDRRQRPALHQLQLDVAVLADARSDDHGTKPSFDGLRGHLRAGDGLSRLQQHHDPGQGDDRQDPQGQWLLDVLVRQGPQHP